MFFFSKVTPQLTAVEIGTTTNPKPVTGIVTQVEVFALITKLSTNFFMLDNILKIYNSLLIYHFYL